MTHHCLEHWLGHRESALHFHLFSPTGHAVSGPPELSFQTSPAVLDSKTGVGGVADGLARIRLAGTCWLRATCLAPPSRGCLECRGRNQKVETTLSAGLADTADQDRCVEDYV